MDRFLPKILAILTSQSREKVAVTWSDTSWTYNVFRLYELIFWRRAGIRIEQVSDSEGNQYSFTFENYLATFEGAVRAYFRRGLGFKIVLIPQMQLVGFQQQFGLSPYRFAIVPDSSEFQTASGTSITYNHTCTGSNLILLTAVQLNTGLGLDDVSGVTYNSVAETQIDKLNVSSDFTYLFNLVAPATNTNSVVVSLTATVGGQSISASYSGAKQSGQPDSHNTNSVTAGSAVNLTTSTSVVAANCWLVCFGRWDQGGIGAGTGAFFRQVASNTGAGFFDSNTTVGTGSQSMQITGAALGAGTSGSMLLASISPSVAGAVVTPKLTLLGVG